MDGRYEGDLIGNSKAKEITVFLRNISKEYVYTNEKVVENELVGYHIIHYLLDTFITAALNKNDCSEEYLRLLLVTDFICGMTDSYAADLYQKIKGMNV